MGKLVAVICRWCVSHRADLDVLVQAAAYKKLDLNTSILFTAFAGRIISNRLQLAKAE